MSFLTRTGPSPAMAVACIAFSLALAGSAAAGTEAVTSKLDSAEKKQVRQIATRVVKGLGKRQANTILSQREGGLNVNSAKTADVAGTATTVGPNGVGTSALRDDVVTTGKLAPKAVTPEKSRGLVTGIASARVTLSQGAGGHQPVIDVPGFGAIRGGCGSVGGALRLANQSGLTLQVALASPGNIGSADIGILEEIAPGESSSLSGPVPGAPGLHMIQASGGSATNARAMTALATSTASSPGESGLQCSVQIQVMTSLP